MVKKNTTLTNKAYTLIKKMIINLQLRPGEIIILNQFADNLNLSRTPVKEALISLSNKGLVERSNGRKYRVTQITCESIKEIFALREALDSHALREIINNFTLSDYSEMDNYIKKMEQAVKENNYDLFYELDNSFHKYYLKKYGNKMIISIMEQINDRLQRARHFSYYINHRAENAINEHENILKSLKDKDVQKTINAYKLHLNNTVIGLLDLLEKKNNKNLAE